jgi:hypothetical protein
LRAVDNNKLESSVYQLKLLTALSDCAYHWHTPQKMTTYTYQCSAILISEMAPWLSLKRPLVSFPRKKTRKLFEYIVANVSQIGKKYRDTS